MSTDPHAASASRILNVRIVTPDRVIPLGTVTLRDGRIGSVRSQREAAAPRAGGDFDARGGTLMPGFIDMHFHGALGHDTMDLDADSWRAICGFLLRHGVTGFLPTASAADAAGIAAYLKLAGEIMAESPAGARVLGVHLEGPYLNPVFRGMHPMTHCRPPDPAEYTPWLAAGVVRRMTASLEVGGAERLLADCARAGVLLSLGHTACLANDVRRWADLGLRHATHLYNAMSRAEKQGPVRVCGCVEGVLTARPVAAEIIGDGNHVPECLFRIAATCKGADGVTIGSDSTLFTGAVREGVPMRYGGSTQEVVVRNGRATSPDGSALIGSVAPLGAMLPRVVGWLDGDLLAAARMFSTNAARLMGLGERKGRIAQGCDADLVLLDEHLQVGATWVGGVRCFLQARE